MFESTPALKGLYAAGVGSFKASFKRLLDILLLVTSSDVALDIYLKYNKYGFELLKKNILNIINDDFKCYKQSSVNASYYSLKTLDFKNINIDYRKTANEIKNQIHAYSFVHYQLPLFNDNKITHAEILPEKGVSIAILT